MVRVIVLQSPLRVLQYYTTPYDTSSACKARMLSTYRLLYSILVARLFGILCLLLFRPNDDVTQGVPGFHLSYCCVDVSERIAVRNKFVEFETSLLIKADQPGNILL